MSMRHSVVLELKRCRGCTTCIKCCPTEAIRVRGRKATILPDRCIDCGSCIRICPHKAIKSVGDSLDILKQYQYCVALPEPALYGQFQHILTQRDGEDVGAEAQAYLEDNGLQQTMTVECLGDPELISGSAVLLRANTTGVTGLCWIDSDTHTWKNGQYFCRLSLNFRSLTNEVEAGQEV